MTDGQRLEALAARRERAGAMIDVAEIIGVEEVGRARRDVGKADEAARSGRALGERRHLERAAGGAAHVIAEVGLADVAHGEARPFGQRHAVTVQPVPRRMAAGGDRGRRDTRHRREDGGVIRAPQALLGQPMEHGRAFRRQPVDAEPIAAVSRRFGWTGTVHANRGRRRCQSR